MERTDTIARELAALAGYLDARRSQLMQGWRETVAADPTLDDASEWTVKQLNDHFPDVLESLGHALRCWPDLPPSLLASEGEYAVLHARGRWVQGYSLRGVMREWGYLNAVIVDHIAAFVPTASAMRVHRTALGIWARLLNDQQTLSALEYHRLEQAEAQTRGVELRRALEALRSGALDRGRAIQALASTMRNDLQVVMTSSALARGEDRWHESYELRKLSQDGFRGLEQALTDMVTLADLEAGNEARQLAPFDAAPGFVLLVEGLQHVAGQSGSRLHAEGPDHLPVTGDAERVRRLAKHLIFCALRAPEPGDVRVRWGMHEGTPARWWFSIGQAVQAPADAPEPGSTLAFAVATEAYQQVAGVPPTGEEAALHDGSVPVAVGDGVDLLIAKHLGNLLGGAFEVEAQGGRLRYRVSLPAAYDGA